MQRVSSRVLVVLILCAASAGLAAGVELRGPDTVRLGQTFTVEVVGEGPGAPLAWTWDTGRLLRAEDHDRRPSFRAIAEGPAFVRVASSGAGWTRTQQVLVRRAVDTGRSPPPVPEGGPPVEEPRIAAARELMDKYRAGNINETNFFVGMKSRELSMRDMVAFKAHVIETTRRSLVDGGTPAQEAIQQSEARWRADYAPFEQNLMAARQQGVNDAWSRALARYAEAHPDTPYIGAKMDVGGWASEPRSAMKFEGDIDFSVITVDVQDGLELRRMFEQEIQRAYDLNMVEIDALATAHRAATSDVYIGDYGAKWAEIDAIRRGKMYKLVIVNGRVDVERDASGQPRQMTMDEKIILLAVLENNEHKRRTGEDILDKLLAEDAGPRADMEPGVSLEFLRHVQHDVLHARLPLTEQIIKISKYVNRSCVDHVSMLSRISGFPLAPKDTALAQAVKTIVDVKSDRAMTPEAKLARVMNVMSALLGAGWAENTRRSLEEVGRRAVALLQHNIDEGVRARLLLAERAPTPREADAAKKKLLDDLENEYRVFQDSHVEFPANAKAEMLRLAEYFLRRGRQLPPQEQERLKDFMEKVASHKPECARLTLASVYQRGLQLYGSADKAIDAVNNFVDFLDNSTIQKLRDTRVIEIDLGGGHKISPASINHTLNQSLLGTIGNNTVFKGFNMVQEGLSYYRAITSGASASAAVENLATEIFRRRVPLGGAVDAYFQENYVRIGVELVYALFPPLAIPEGLCGMAAGAAEWGLSVVAGWKYDAMVEALYKNAVFVQEDGAWRLDYVEYACPGRGARVVRLSRANLARMPDECPYVWQMLAPQFRNHGVIHQYEEMLAKPAVSGGPLTSAGWPYEYLFLNDRTGRYLHGQYKAKVHQLAREYFLKVVALLEERKEWDEETGFSKATALAKALGCPDGAAPRTGHRATDTAVYRKLLADGTAIERANTSIDALKRAWSAEFLERIQPGCTPAGFQSAAAKATAAGAALKAAVERARTDVQQIVGAGGCTPANLGPATRARLGVAWYPNASDAHRVWYDRYEAALSELRGRFKPVVVVLEAPATAYVGTAIRIAARFDRALTEPVAAWDIIGAPTIALDEPSPAGARWTPRQEGTYRVRLKIKPRGQAVPSVASVEIRVLPASARPVLKVALRAPVTELAEDEAVTVTAEPVELGPDRSPFVRYFWYEDGHQTRATATGSYEFTGAGKAHRQVPLTVVARNQAGEVTPEDGVLMKVTRPASPGLVVTIAGGAAEIAESGALTLRSAVARKRDSGAIRLQWTVDGQPAGDGPTLSLAGATRAGKTVHVTLFAQDDQGRDGRAALSVRVKAEGALRVELSHAPRTTPEDAMLEINVSHPVGAGYHYRWSEWRGRSWGPAGFEDRPQLSYNCRGKAGQTVKFRVEVTDSQGRTGAAETPEIKVTGALEKLTVVAEPESATAMPGDAVRFRATITGYSDSGALKVNGVALAAGTASVELRVEIDPGSPPIVTAPVEVVDARGRRGEAVFTVYTKDRPAAGAVTITGPTTVRAGERITLTARTSAPAPRFEWTGATGTGATAAFQQDRVGDHQVGVKMFRGNALAGTATHRVVVKAGDAAVKITAPASGQETPDTTIAVAGTVSGFESVASMEMIVNGAAYAMPPSAAFSQKMPIVPGQNTLQVAAKLKDGRVVRSAVVTVKSTQSAANRYRFTLRWNTAKTDIDLHLVGPKGTSCSYRSKHTPFAELDKDVIHEGFGPENIFIKQLTDTGTYKVRVHYYGDHNTGANRAPPTQPEVLFFVDNKLEKSWKGQLPAVGAWWDVYSFSYGFQVELAAPAKTRVNVGETLSLNAVVKDTSAGLGERLKAAHTFRWTADGGTEFSPADTVKPKTTALFTRPGTVRLRVQVIGKQGDRETVLAESEPVSIEVVSSAYRIVFDPPQPMVGQEAVATVTADRPLDRASLDFRWEVTGPVLRHGAMQTNDPWHYGVTGSRPEPVTVTARGRTPFHGDDAGSASGTFTPKLYTVKAVCLGGAYGGVRPRVYDPARREFIDAPQGTFLVDQELRLRATLEGSPPPAEVRWKWTVNSGTSLGNDISPEPTVSRHEPGTIEATVEAQNAERVVLGGARVSVPIASDGGRASPLAVTVTAAPTTIKSGEVATARASARGGRAPYSFTWSGGASGQGPEIALRGGRPGIVALHVAARDSGTQHAQGSVSIRVEPVTLQVALDPSARTVPAGTAVSLTARVTGGVPPYTCSWKAPAAGHAATARVLPARPGALVIECTVRDACNNSGTGRVTLDVTPLDATIALPDEVSFGAAAPVSLRGGPAAAFRVLYRVSAGTTVAPDPAPGGQATLTFLRAGAAQVQAEIQVQDASGWTVVHRTPPKTVRVGLPRLELAFSPAAACPGVNVDASLVATPALPPAHVSLSWQGAAASARPLTASFAARDLEPVAIEVAVRGRAGGESLGVARGTYRPKPVVVQVRVAGARTPERPYAPGDRVVLEAKVTEGPPNLRLDWVAHNATIAGPATGPRVRVEGLAGPTAFVTVTAALSPGHPVGQAAIAIPVAGGEAAAPSASPGAPGTSGPVTHYKLDFARHNSMGRYEGQIEVDGVPLAGNPISWLSSTDSASGGQYPEAFGWTVPGVPATELVLASNLSWWGAALSGRTIARITVTGADGATANLDIVAGVHTAEWNGGTVTGTPPAVRVVRGTPGPCSTWFVSRFPLGSMTVTSVHIKLLEVARNGGKAGVFEIHGITLVGPGPGSAGGAP